MRYRNVTTGALVDVRDDKALGSEWEAQPPPKTESRKPATKQPDAPTNKARSTSTKK